MFTTVNALKGLGACSEATEWVALQKSPEQAWKDCVRGDWMLWILGRLSGWTPFGSPERRHLAGCIAEIVISHAYAYATTAEATAYAAAYAADAAADAAYAAVYAAEAAEAAAAEAAEAVYAADAADDAAAEAAEAVYAADAADDAAAEAAEAAKAAAKAARKESLASSADIVRIYYPDAPTFEK